MRVCKVWDADYPWDIRVEKIVNSLDAAGHTVHLVCRNHARRARYERAGNLHIHRLPSVSGRLGPVHTAVNFPHPVNPVWFQEVRRAVVRSEADLLLIRDIPLALPAILVGRARRIPVVLDMAENYAAMLQDRLRYTSTGNLGRLVRRPALARMVERVAVRLVDHVIVVIEESRERLIRAGVEPERLSIVSNTPRLEGWNGTDRSADDEGLRDGVRVVYLGNLDGSRGLDVAIRAIRHLKDRGHRAHLDVIGDGPSMGALRALSAELGTDDRVNITGRLPFREVQALMGRAHVGLIPHYRTDAWNTTIPNKLFDYMLLGLPVVVSDVRPTARIVLDTDCGEVFRDRDTADLAGCISRLEDARLRKVKGRNGVASIRDRYNWARDSAVLVRTLESLGQRPNGVHLGV